MALTSEEQQKVANGLMRWWSGIWEAIGISSDDLLAAVAATDGWIEDNQASYNNALPNPAKSELTAIQKTLLFCAVALARVSLTMLRRVFGEVD